MRPRPALPASRRAAASALALAAGLTSFSCDESNFEPGSRVARVRVLAVRADPPFARPGEEVRLEALAYDPAGRALSWGWSSCGSESSSSALACLGAAPGAVAAEPGAWALRVPDDALAVGGSGRAAAALGVNVVVCPGAITPGPTQGVPVGCVDDGGAALRLDEFEVGTKRVVVREFDRNENPAVGGVFWDGAEWAADVVPEVDACDETGDDFGACDETLARRVDVALGPAEAGVDEFGVAFAEQQIVHYYASEGIFEDEIRAAPSTETRWVARRAASGSVVTFWFVARDDRGGVAWATRRARVR